MRAVFSIAGGKAASQGLLGPVYRPLPQPVEKATRPLRPDATPPAGQGFRGPELKSILCFMKGVAGAQEEAGSAGLPWAVLPRLGTLPFEGLGFSTRMRPRWETALALEQVHVGSSPASPPRRFGVTCCLGPVRGTTHSAFSTLSPPRRLSEDSGPPSGLTEHPRRGTDRAAPMLAQGALCLTVVHPGCRAEELGTATEPCRGRGHPCGGAGPQQWQVLTSAHSGSSRPLTGCPHAFLLCGAWELKLWSGFGDT